jgi:hypothetical protein
MGGSHVAISRLVERVTAQIGIAKLALDDAEWEIVR